MCIMGRAHALRWLNVTPSEFYRTLIVNNQQKAVPLLFDVNLQEEVAAFVRALRVALGEPVDIA